MAKDFTTKANVVSALGITDDGDDTRISNLIPLVTDVMLRVMDRPGFFLNDSDVTVFLEALNPKSTILHVDRYPDTSVTTLYESEDIPRVYDASTLLVADTDYLVDPDRGIIHKLAGYWSTEPRSIRLAYDGGYLDETTVPSSLITASHMIIANILQKQKSRMYHLTKSELGEGIVEGIRREDIPDTAREILESWKRGAVE